MTADEQSTPKARVFTLDAYTDDTAPDYDGLTVVYTTVLSALVAAATVAVVWLLEDSAIASVADETLAIQGPVEAVLVGIPFGVVLFGAFAAGRYVGVRTIDTDDIPRTVAVTLVQIPVYAVLLAVTLEVYLGGVGDRFFLLAGGGAVGLVVVGNLVVLATDWDLSVAASVGVLALALFVAVALVASVLWQFTGDGLLWSAYLFLWGVNLYVVLPTLFLGLYVHDVWRVSERGMPPTVAAMSTFTALAGLALIPVEYVVGAVDLVLEADDEDDVVGLEDEAVDDVE